MSGDLSFKDYVSDVAELVGFWRKEIDGAAAGGYKGFEVTFEQLEEFISVIDGLLLMAHTANDVYVLEHDARIAAESALLDLTESDSAGH